MEGRIEPAGKNNKATYTLPYINIQATFNLHVGEAYPLDRLYRDGART
jgi:hypothetical protein